MMTRISFRLAALLIATHGLALPAQTPSFESGPTSPAGAAVATFLETDRTDTEQVIVAVESLYRLGHVDEATRLWDESIGRWEVADRVSAVRAIGTPRLMQLGTMPGASDSVRQGIVQLLRAVRQATTEPDQIARQIDEWLGDAGRATSPRALLELGDRLAAAAVNRSIAQPNGQDDRSFPLLVQLVARLGDTAVPPLAAVLGQPRDEAHRFARQTLATIDTPLARRALLAAGDVRIADPAPLVDQLERLWELVIRLESDAIPGVPTTTIWRWDRATERVVAQQVTPEVATAWEAIGVSRAMEQLGQANVVRELQLHLYLDKQLNGYRNRLPEGAGTARELALAAPVGQFRAALDDAVQHGPTLAAVALWEVARDRPDRLQGVDWSSSLRHVDHRLRFTALDASLRSGRPPTRQQLDQLGWFASSRGAFRGLVVGGPSDRRRELVGWLTEAGLPVDETASARAALRYLHGVNSAPTADYLVVFALDPIELNRGEFVRLLRGGTGTGSLDLVWLEAEVTGQRTEPISEGSHLREMADVAPYPSEARTVQRLLARLERQRSLYFVDRTERDQQALAAVEWLAYLAGDDAASVMRLVRRLPSTLAGASGPPSLQDAVRKLQQQLKARHVSQARFALPRDGAMLLPSTDREAGLLRTIPANIDSLSEAVP